MTWAVLVVLVISMVMKISSAGSCVPAHPQEKFCRADFVLRGKVVEEDLSYFAETESVSHRTYTVTVTKRSHIFKGELLPGNITIVTAGSDITNGVTMATDGDYIISGIVLPDGSLLTTSCEFVLPYMKLTSHQRRGLKFKYELGCMCKMKGCFGDQCTKRSDVSEDNDVTCFWNQTNYPHDCYTKYTFCLNNKDGVCQWKSNRMFDKCITSDELSP